MGTYGNPTRVTDVAGDEAIQMRTLFLLAGLIATPMATPMEDNVTCYPLFSAVICHLPVTVGPFDIDVPINGSLFPAPQP